MTNPNQTPNYNNGQKQPAAPQKDAMKNKGREDADEEKEVSDRDEREEEDKDAE